MYHTLTILSVFAFISLKKFMISFIFSICIHLISIDCFNHQMQNSKINLCKNQNWCCKQNSTLLLPGYMIPWCVSIVQSISRGVYRNPSWGSQTQFFQQIERRSQTFFRLCPNFKVKFGVQRGAMPPPSPIMPLSISNEHSQR